MKKSISILIAFFVCTTFALAQKALHGEVSIKKDTVYVGGQRYCVAKTTNLGNNIRFFNFEGRVLVEVKYVPGIFKILFVESGRTAQFSPNESFLGYTKAIAKAFEMNEVIINGELDKKGELRFVRRYPDRDIFGKVIQKAGEALDNDLEQASRDGFDTKEAESLKARNPSANGNAANTPTQGSTTAQAAPAPTAANDVIDRDRTKPMTLENGEIKQDNQLVGKYSTSVGQWNNETTIIIKFYFAGGKQIAEARVPLSKSTEAEVITLKDNQKHAVPTPNNSKETDVAKFLLDRYYF